MRTNRCAAGGWAVETNQYGRLAALGLLALFAMTLLSERLAHYLLWPVPPLGRRLSSAIAATPGPLPSALLGIATGLLWAPCAGPILGLILTGAALNGASAWTSLLLLAYALGAATSLALALLAGGRMLAFLKRTFRVGEWLRRSLGVAVLAGVVLVSVGLDGQLLSKISFASPASIAETLLNCTGVHGAAASTTAPIDDAARRQAPAPMVGRAATPFWAYAAPSPSMRSWSRFSYPAPFLRDLHYVLDH